MNILFPIAGEGSRFKKRNISTPKPFIKFKGRTYLEWAICSLKIKGNYFDYISKNSFDNYNSNFDKSSLNYLEVNFYTK